jgi:hypothetical protein
MAGTGVDDDLILRTFALTFGLAAAAIAVVGLVYRLTRSLAEAEFGPSRHPTRTRPRALTLEADERWLAAAAYRRAVGIAVALLALLVASPWLNAPVDRLADRWRDAAAGNDWRYGMLAVLLWLGLVPLAVFLRALPRRAWARRRVRWKEWATRLGTSSSPGLPNSIAPNDLTGSAPYYAALARACRLRGVNAALGAGGGRREQAGWAGMPELLIVPTVGALLLAGFVQVWIAPATVAVVALGALGVGWQAKHDALSAPGTAALDYLILMAAARDGRHGEARARAEAYLSPNPGTSQDHANLLAALASARWIDEPRWDPAPVPASEVVVPAALEIVDRAGRERRINVAIRLLRSGGRHWQVARVWAEQTALIDGETARVAMPVPVAW